MSADPTLFDNPPRPTDTLYSSLLNERPAQEENEESVLAAISMAPFVSGQRGRVLDYLREWGPATDEQIADACGLSPSSERPRRVELERAGLVVRAGTAKTRSGRSAALWSAA